MANPVLLNNIEHKDLRINTSRGAAYGDDVMLALTFPAEFRDLQAHYPIVFRKGADGVTFEAYAMLGFQDGENLFLEGDVWDAPALPLSVARQPFLIGLNGDEMMVHVDLDNPRVGKQAGEPVFLPHGGNTEYLESVSAMLATIDQGLQSMPAFVAALLEHALLESFVLDVELNDGAQHRLSGFYTINEERLQAVGAEALAAMNRNGYLQAIYMVIASMSNLRVLIERKNRRHAGQR